MGLLIDFVALLLVVVVVGAVLAVALGILGAGIGNLGNMSREFKKFYVREAWRVDHPRREFDLAHFSPLLVDVWCRALEREAIGRDRSYDFTGEEGPPSDEDWEAAHRLRELAKWLLANAGAVQDGTMRGEGWKQGAGKWIQIARQAQRSNEHTATLLTEPHLYWSSIDDADALASLVAWLTAQAAGHDADVQVPSWGPFRTWLNGPMLAPLRHPARAAQREPSHIDPPAK